MRASELHRLARTLREIALDATGNTGGDRVNAGQLAVFEDIARHPGSSIREITARTGLAQSLVSRIVQTAADQDALQVSVDGLDRRRVRVELSPSTAASIARRAGASIDAAIAARTPALSDDERAEIVHHLSRAAAFLSR